MHINFPQNVWFFYLIIDVFDFTLEIPQMKRFNQTFSISNHSVRTVQYYESLKISSIIQTVSIYTCMDFESKIPWAKKTKLFSFDIGQTV